MSIRLKRLGLASAARFGFVAGAVTAMPVGVIASFLVRLVVAWLRQSLESWQRTTLDVGLARVPVDIIRLLNLGNALQTIRVLDDLPLATLLIVFLALVVIAGLLGMAMTLVWALAYNAIAGVFGGLAVELESAEGTRVIVIQNRSGGGPAA